MKIKSNVTNKEYYANETVRILNVQQVIAYLNFGVELLDIYPSKDRNSDKQLLVYVFDKEKSKEAYDLWCKHELK